MTFKFDRSAINTMLESKEARRALENFSCNIENYELLGKEDTNWDMCGHLPKENPKLFVFLQKDSRTKKYYDVVSVQRSMFSR